MRGKAPGREPGSWLSAAGAFGLRRPKLAVIVGLVLLAVSAAGAWGIPISTSRYKLVAADNPFQAKLLRFFDRFGYPDSLVWVVSGCSEQERRDVVDRLRARMAEEPELRGRVLGRIDADKIAEVLLLMAPEALAQMRARLDAEPADLIEGGLPAWVGALEAQLTAGLEGEGADGGAPDEKQANEAILGIASALRAFDAHLSGGDPVSMLRGVDRFGSSAGVDERGYVVSTDGESHLVALFPELEGEAEGYQVKPLVDRLRAGRDEVGTGACRAELTGLPALVADELVVLQEALRTTSIATTAGIVLLLLIAFRSFRYTLLALLPVGIGAVLTMAATRLIYHQLNLITSSFMSVLLGLGIAFGVVAMGRFAELLREGQERDEAILGALRKAGPGILVGGITTILAFLTCNAIEFTAYGELGVIVAVGLTLMLLVSFVLLPALIHLAGRGKKPLAAPELPGAARLPGLVHKGRWVFPVVAIALAALSATKWWDIEFNARYFDFLPEDTESAAGLRRIETDRMLSPVQAEMGADSVEEARRIAGQLRELPSVGAVQTATDLLPELTKEKLAALRAGFADLERQPSFDKLRNRPVSAKELAARVRALGDVLDEVGFAMRQANRKTTAVDEAKKAAAALSETLSKMPDRAPELVATQKLVADVLERAWSTARAVAKRGHYLPTDLPSVFAARFVSEDGKALAVFATPKGDIWNADVAAQFAKDVYSVHPDASGLAVTIHEHLRMIKSGFQKASGLSAVLVFIVLLLGFRRLDDALLAAVPVGLGVCWLLGIMGTAGIDFDVANLVAIPLVVGIGVDAGAHMVHRWRQSATERGGVADIGEVLRGTGAAVLLASLTSATGFAALMTGQYGGMKTVGLSVTLGILGCLLASLVVLPALLMALGKAK